MYTSTHSKEISSALVWIKACHIGLGTDSDQICDTLTLFQISINIGSDLGNVYALQTKTNDGNSLDINWLCKK